MKCKLEEDKLILTLPDGALMVYIFSDKPIDINNANDGFNIHPLINIFSNPENIFSIIDYDKYCLFIKLNNIGIIEEDMYKIPKEDAVVVYYNEKYKKFTSSFWNDLLKVAWSFDLTIPELIIKVNNL